MLLTKDQILTELSDHQLVEVERVMNAIPREVSESELMKIIETVLFEPEVYALKEQLKRKYTPNRKKMGNPQS